MLFGVNKLCVLSLLPIAGLGIALLFSNSYSTENMAEARQIEQESDSQIFDLDEINDLDCAFSEAKSWQDPVFGIGVLIKGLVPLITIHQRASFAHLARDPPRL